MQEKEMKKLAAEIAKNVVELLSQDNRKQPAENDELVNSTEAARLLNISPAYLRQIKDKLPHVKRGAYKQGRILFRKADLVKYYTLL